jgi:hypothetical protein
MFVGGSIQQAFFGCSLEKSGLCAGDKNEEDFDPGLDLPPDLLERQTIHIEENSAGCLL